jgi:hypothetical protein
MGRQAAPDPNAKICTECKSLVVPDTENGGFKHKSSAKESSHPVTKTQKWGTYNDALQKARGFVKNEAGAWVNPKKPKEEKPAKSRRKSQKELDDAKKVREAARDERRKQKEEAKYLPDEYWSPSKGYHRPLSTSTVAVVHPETKELIVPATGEVRGKWAGELPARPGSEDDQKINAALDHLATHPEHKWSLVMDGGKPLSTIGLRALQIKSKVEALTSDPKKRKKAMDLQTRGKKAIKEPDINTGLKDMNLWASEVKHREDPNDEYEYGVFKPTVLSDDDYRNVPFTKEQGQDVGTSGALTVYKRKRHCALCAPTVDTTTNRGSRLTVANPNRVFDRSRVHEWGIGALPTVYAPNHLINEIRKVRGTPLAGPSSLELRSDQVRQNADIAGQQTRRAKMEAAFAEARGEKPAGEGE